MISINPHANRETGRGNYQLSIINYQLLNYEA
jgi:hypothetical protein